MPTPFAHALGGVAAGCLVTAAAALAAGGRPSARAIRTAVARIGPRRCAACLACLGMLPDLDLLVGSHRGVTHSIGAALAAGGVGYALARSGRLLVAVAVAAAYGSHLLLDWLGTDPGVPAGIMALWPWTREFHLSDTHLFPRVCREYWLAECWRTNLIALGREIVVLVPVTAAAGLAAHRVLAARGETPRRTETGGAPG